MHEKSFRSLVVFASLAAAAASASGDPSGSVHLPLHGNDRVMGTLRPASDQECFACDAPQGAAFAVTLRRKPASAPPFALAMTQNDLAVPGATFTTKGNTVSLSKFAAPSSGRYFLCVAGDSVHDGDYALSVAWKPKTAWSAAGGPLDPGSSDSFTFAAPAGANATIDVRPAAHSAFSGTITGVTGPDGPLVLPPGTASHLVLTHLAKTGDYAVAFRNDGASASNWTAKAAVKPPRTAPSSVDIRDSRLTGAFGGDHTVYGSVLGPDGGSIDVTATYGPLDGTSVSLPPGVLPGPTILTISAASSIPLGSGDHAAGPSVEFGPPGTTFDPSGTDPSKQATITIPFDPTYFPSGTDSLVIFVRSSSGAVSAVPRPYTFGADTVSFTTSHFSSYQAATTGPRALSGSFLRLQVGAEDRPGFAGAFRFAMDRLDANANGATLVKDDQAVTWADAGAQGSSASLNENFQQISLGVQVPDDADVLLTDPADPANPAKFRRGASDDVLVGVKQPVVLLRLAGAAPTTTTAAGRWHLFHLSMATGVLSTVPPTISLDAEGDAGEITLATDGSVTVASAHGFDASSNYPAGTWTPQEHTKPPQGISWSIEEIYLRLSVPDLTYPILFTTVLDGDVLVGRGTTIGGGKPGQGPSADLFVLVRASPNAALARMVGDYLTIGSEADTRDTLPSGQGFDITVPTLTATISPTGVLSVVGTQDVTTHDGQGQPATTSDVPLSGKIGKLTLDASGSFTTTDGAAGAFSRGGDLLVRALFDGKQFSLDFGTPLVLNQRKADRRR
jgi:hypothetical protein